MKTKEIIKKLQVFYFLVNKNIETSIDITNIYKNKSKTDDKEGGLIEK